MCAIHGEYVLVVSLLGSRRCETLQQRTNDFARYSSAVAREGSAIAKLFLSEDWRSLIPGFSRGVAGDVDLLVVAVSEWLCFSYFGERGHLT